MAEKKVIFSGSRAKQAAGEMVRSGQYLRFGDWLAEHPEDFSSLDKRSQTLARVKCVQNYLKTDEAKLSPQDRKEAEAELKNFNQI